jgi:integrase
MSKSHSTAPAGDGKPVEPSKPYPEFPLTAHPAEDWCKKIRGKIHYFGPWDDPDGALKKYLEQKDALHAGRKPRPEAEALTVKELANAYLNHKQTLVDAGELSPLTWADYKCVADELVAHPGKSRIVADLDAEDFAGLRTRMSKKWGPHRLEKAVQYVRSIFKHAYESGLIDRPMRFGPECKRPSMKTLRLHRAEQGANLFTADEVRRLIAAAATPLTAMLLLGVNCGFGNADCGNLPLTALDPDRGWVDYPRPKTGIARRCPLWPETVEAIREALAKRPRPPPLAPLPEARHARRRVEAAAGRRPGPGRQVRVSRRGDVLVGSHNRCRLALAKDPGALALGTEGSRPLRQARNEEIGGRRKDEPLPYEQVLHNLSAIPWVRAGL